MLSFGDDKAPPLNGPLASHRKRAQDTWALLMRVGGSAPSSVFLLCCLGPERNGGCVWCLFIRTRCSSVLFCFVLLFSESVFPEVHVTINVGYQPDYEVLPGCV